MADEIHIEGSVHSGGNTVFGDYIVNIIDRRGQTTIQQIAPPTPNPGGGNTPALIEYLHGFHAWANQQLEQTTRAFLTPLTKDAPDAVRTAWTFAPGFRTSPVKSNPQQPSPTITPDEARFFDTLAAAFHHHNQRLLLLGDPGMGKTTALLHLARSAAAQRLADPTAPIPILASIYTWNHKTPLTQWANPPGLPLDNQPLLYLLDGLDELGGPRPIDPNKRDGPTYDPRADFIRATEHLPAHAALVISSRIKDYADIGQQIRLPGAATLQPLADEQVQRYLAAHEQPELWETIKQDDSLLELARTPLLLALITIGFAGKQAELTNVTRADVFDHYIHARFQHEQSRLPQGQSLPFDEATTRELLGKIAVEMWIGYWWTDRVSLTADDIKALVADSGRLVAFGQHMHLLQQRPDGAIQFIHLALRDYCAVPGLLVALRDQNWVLRRSAAWALEQIGDPVAVPNLLVALHDQNNNVRHRAAGALGQIGAPAIPGLLEALSDQNRDVRSSAAGALGKIGDPAAIPGLLAALSGQDGYVRYSAASALGKIGGPAAIPALLTVLSDQDSEVRYNTARALGQIGNPAAVPGLVERLSDTEKPYFWSEERICDAAARALEQIGTPEALAALEQWQQQSGGP